ncbi:MAG: hypothetical protein ABS99_03970 [Acetobacteraceae bacterium SCN 69-10]|nr:MAG: hypothetical protein ABS99_03970 [Acetobacteraceae bacterium SCN 69-10]
MTRGHHLTPARRAELDALLLAGAGYKDPRLAGFSQSTITAARRRLGLSPPKVAASVSPSADPPPADPVEIARLKGRVAALAAENRHLAERARRAEDLRAGLFGLTDTPPDPIAFRAPPGGAAQAETIVLFLSDLHWGEVVDLAAMDGLNSYDLAIARARLGRWFQTVADLATKHWTGPPPARLILVLGGDLVSGEIHAELAKTNEAKALPAVKDLAGHLAEGVSLLRRRLACPIDVVSLAGNHGRSTLKPESKESVETSYDILVSDFLEMALRGRDGIAFWVPSSVDAVFSVYGWRVLATHGDRIGSRGGTGFIGPAATAARGMKRLVADYAARGIHLDLILIGHFHTPLMLEEGFVNGCLPGPSEYSRDGRFRPAPARQLWLTLHPRRGVTTTRWIHVGAPAEGALYAPPPEDRELRPRWRVPAVGVPRR